MSPLVHFLNRPPARCLVGRAAEPALQSPVTPGYFSHVSFLLADTNLQASGTSSSPVYLLRSTQTG
jgi:hypothetical protein